MNVSARDEELELEAACDGRTDVVRQLLDEGVSVFAHFRALQQAVGEDHEDVAELLIERWPENGVPRGWTSALDEAAQEHNTRGVEIMLRVGHPTLYERGRALWYAADGDHAAAIDALLTAGVVDDAIRNALKQADAAGADRAGSLMRAYLDHRVLSEVAGDPGPDPAVRKRRM